MHGLSQVFLFIFTHKKNKLFLFFLHQLFKELLKCHME